MTWRCTIAPLLTVLFASSPAAGFVRSHVDDNPEVYLFWPERTVAVMMNSEGSQDVEPGAMRAAVLRALTAWSANDCTDLYLTWGGETASRTTNLMSAAEPDHVNTVVWREDDWPEDIPSETLALTTLVYDAHTGSIVDGDIDLNGAEFYWTTTEDHAFAQTDVQNTITHELGHLLGLDHSSDPQSTMFGSTEPGEFSKRDLGEDDLEALCYMYPSDEVTPRGTLTAEPAPLKLEGTSCRISPTSRSGRFGVLVLVGVALAFARRRRQR